MTLRHDNIRSPAKQVGRHPHRGDLRGPGHPRGCLSKIRFCASASDTNELNIGSLNPSHHTSKLAIREALLCWTAG
jgi:hypothetical protein